MTDQWRRTAMNRIYWTSSPLAAIPQTYWLTNPACSSHLHRFMIFWTIAPGETGYGAYAVSLIRYIDYVFDWCEPINWSLANVLRLSALTRCEFWRSDDNIGCKPVCINRLCHLIFGFLWVSVIRLTRSQSRDPLVNWFSTLKFPVCLRPRYIGFGVPHSLCIRISLIRRFRDFTSLVCCTDWYAGLERLPLTF